MNHFYLDDNIGQHHDGIPWEIGGGSTVDIVAEGSRVLE
jgi:hypothetical protein